MRVVVLMQAFPQSITAVSSRRKRIRTRLTLKSSIRATRPSRRKACESYRFRIAAQPPACFNIAWHSNLPSGTRVITFSNITRCQPWRLRLVKKRWITTLHPLSRIDPVLTSSRSAIKVCLWLRMLFQSAARSFIKTITMAVNSHKPKRS